MPRKTRQTIRRIDTRPQNRPDVAAGVRNAKLDTAGQLIGGITPAGVQLGSSGGARPASRPGGVQGSKPIKAQGIATNQPNAAAQQLIGGGLGAPANSAPMAKPLQPSKTVGMPNIAVGQEHRGLDRWFAMNPEARPGQLYNRKESEAQSRHRAAMREEAYRRRIAKIQGTASEEAALSALTGMPVTATEAAKQKERKKRKAAQRALVPQEYSPEKEQHLDKLLGRLPTTIRDGSDIFAPGSNIGINQAELDAQRPVAEDFKAGEVEDADAFWNRIMGTRRIDPFSQEGIDAGMLDK